jgi:hypothetical protein
MPKKKPSRTTNVMLWTVGTLLAGSLVVNDNSREGIMWFGERLGDGVSWVGRGALAGAKWALDLDDSGSSDDGSTFHPIPGVVCDQPMEPAQVNPGESEVTTLQYYNSSLSPDQQAKLADYLHLRPEVVGRVGWVTMYKACLPESDGN